MTLAPPPATIVQMRPFGFKTVNFKDALVCNKLTHTHVLSLEQLSFSHKRSVLRTAYTFSSKPWMKLSVGLRTLPNGRGNSMSPHLKFQGLSYVHLLKKS